MFFGIFQLATFDDTRGAMASDGGEAPLRSMAEAEAAEAAEVRGLQVVQHPSGEEFLMILVHYSCWTMLGDGDRSG